MLDVITLWRACRPPPGMIAGMAAGFIPVAGHLPDAGGVLDQGAWIMAAMSILDADEAERATRRG